MTELYIHPDIKRALADGHPVVALESAVTTAGLPRTQIKPPTVGDPGIDDLLQTWRNDQPVNLETALAMARAVENSGALPAVVAVLDGALRIGLEVDQIDRLARDETASKCAEADMAVAIARQQTSGTTVSATLAACRLCDPPLRIFATGGIGGVHRHWNQLPDVSADLRALSHTPVCVVCSGAKSLLDLPATIEALESLGVLVIGYRTDHLPQFIAGVRDDLPLRHRADDAGTVAEICRLHWQVLDQQSAVVVANPCPAALSLESDEVDSAVRRAEEDASRQGVSGAARTPFVLDRVVQYTDGRSLAANIGLLVSNGQLAATIACQWADLGNGQASA